MFTAAPAAPTTVPVSGICIFYASEGNICANVRNSDGCFIYYFEAPSMSFRPEDHLSLYEDLSYFMKYAISGGLACAIKRAERDPIGKLAEVSVDIRENVRHSYTMRITEIQRLEDGEYIPSDFPYRF